MASMEEKLRNACRDGTIIGAVACAVSADDSFSYQKAFGELKLDSILRIASCTKLVTSIAVLQLVEKGLIGLDDDVSTIVPIIGQQKILVEIKDGKEVYEDRKNPVTLRRLITHSAGTAAGFFEEKMFAWHDKRGTRHVLTKGTNVETRYLMPLDYDPGTSWAYGSGHDWAGRVVEEVSGQKLDDIFEDNIFKPLGITSMRRWPEKDPELAPRLGAIYKRDAESGKLTRSNEYPPYTQTAAFGGSGLACTMPDYLKILRSLLRNDGVLVKPETGTMMFLPTLTPESHAALNAAMVSGFGEKVPGEFPRSVKLDFGLGAMLFMDDTPGWRYAGTLTWGGLPNLSWFVDRKKGLCGIFGTQVLPTGDVETKKLTSVWEREMYANAGDR